MPSRTELQLLEGCVQSLVKLPWFRLYGQNGNNSGSVDLFRIHFYRIRFTKLHAILVKLSDSDSFLSGRVSCV